MHGTSEYSGDGGRKGGETKGGEGEKGARGKGYGRRDKRKSQRILNKESQPTGAETKTFFSSFLSDSEGTKYPQVSRTSKKG